MAWSGNRDRQGNLVGHCVKGRDREVDARAMQVSDFQFGIRDTPAGAVAWVVAPSGRKREKRFRNTIYCTARVKAQGWIDEQKAVVIEHETVKRGRPATGKTPPRQLGRVDDETWELIGRAAELLDKSKTEFMVETIVRKAKRVVREKDT